MNRTDLQKLARLRIKEARVLLDNEQFAGSYYLAGYSIECALKACIAKKVKKHDFPERTLILRAYTHNLSELLTQSDLKHQLETEMNSNNWLATTGLIKLTKMRHCWQIHGIKFPHSFFSHS